MPQPREGASAAAYNNKVYIEGGYGDYAYHNTLWAWNPALGSYQWPCRRHFR